jgi:hypothetical protein
MTPGPRRFREELGSKSNAPSSNDDPTSKVPVPSHNTHARQTNCASDFSEWRSRTRNDERPPSCFSVKSSNGVWSMADQQVNRATPISHLANLGHRRSPDFFSWPGGTVAPCLLYFSGASARLSGATEVSSVPDLVRIGGKFKCPTGESHERLL